ncbi:hypothetical protein [Cytobacillus kochii]|uniref:hypothetical protein n=1 Tax=Cytobacillus kochii TaxID=859143 RepID=UPI002042441E|nr:hypothetical protein [Cytobacillus kochii]MCM3323525.1 hypothetical protein [Cytobacillus kochii]MCM3345920.1 hypothetical protein [Cytobacillus kochii]
MRVREIKENILISNNKKLISWIYVNFSLQNSIGESIHKLNSLKRLERDTVIFAIARMEQIEASYDSSKHIGILVSVIVFLYSIYKVLIPENFVILLLLPLLFFVILNWRRERKVYQAAVYFKRLMLEVKEYQKGN